MPCDGGHRCGRHPAGAPGHPRPVPIRWRLDTFVCHSTPACRDTSHDRGGATHRWPCQHRRSYLAPHRGDATHLLALPTRPPGPRSLPEETRHVCFAVAARPPATGPVIVDVRHVGVALPPPRPPLHRPATRRFDTRWIGARHGRASAPAVRRSRPAYSQTHRLADSHLATGPTGAHDAVRGGAPATRRDSETTENPAQGARTTDRPTRRCS